MPTYAELGFVALNDPSWFGLVAPAGTPAAAINRVRDAAAAALKDPAVIQKINDLGAVIVPESKQNPAALQAWLTSEIAKWGPLLKAAGQYAD